MIQIRDKSKCCGCEACSQICPHNAIHMISDNEGFLYPHVDMNSCVDCGICEKVCPYIGEVKTLSDKPLSYACSSKNNALRENSSSGGLFTIIADYVIDMGGVVFGARFDENWCVSHTYVEKKSDIAIFRGSKYVQSKIGKSYIEARNFLKEGRMVLFTGTPCQILGLNKFLHRRYDNLITVDVVCHSIPSPEVWGKYLKELCGSRYKVSYVNFKDKHEGWDKYGLLIKVIDSFDNEKRIVRSSHKTNIYMRAFLTNLIARPSCTNCPARNYVSGSDITLADCWGFNTYHPELNDNKGMNLALLNTLKGITLYRKLESTFFSLHIPFCEVEENTNHLPLIKPAVQHYYRKQFFKYYQKGYNVIDLMKKFVNKGERRKRIISKAKQMARIFLPVHLLRR